MRMAVRCACSSLKMVDVVWLLYSFVQIRVLQQGGVFIVDFNLLLYTFDVRLTCPLPAQPHTAPGELQAL